MSTPSVLLLHLCMLFAEAWHYDSYRPFFWAKPSLIGTPRHRDRDLRFVATIWRHGSRAPIKDPFTNSSEELKARWAGGIGGLTKQGEREMIALGLFLRKRYHTFLRGWRADSVSVTSSAIPRAIRSAELKMKAMFPGIVGDGNCTENCQEIPIEIIPAEHDTMIDIDFANCPYPYRPLLLSVVEIPGMKKLLKKHAKILMQVAKMLKKEPKPMDIYGLHDALQSYMYHSSMKSYLPQWARSEDFYDELTDLVLDAQTRWVRTEQYRRLRGSNLFKRIADQLSEAVKTNMTETSLKYAGYSAHDFTVIALLVDWDYFIPEFTPHYAACIMVELRKFDDGYFVEAWYKQGHHREPFQIKIKDCGWQCPLEKFVELADQLSSVDISEQCAQFKEKDLRYIHMPH